MENIAWFKDISTSEIQMVGERVASLSEIINEGLLVPDGFVVTPQAYQNFIREAGIVEYIDDLLENGEINDSENFSVFGEKIQNFISNVEVPQDIKEDVIGAYEQLCDRIEKENVSPVVHLSLSHEYLSYDSRSGKNESYKYISGSEELLECLKNFWGTIISDKGIIDREKTDYGLEDVFPSVTVQEVIDAEKAGVLFTSHPSTGDKDIVVIEANWGLSETVVSGSVTPDIYQVDKKSNEIISTTTGSKEAMVILDKGAESTIEKPTPFEKRENRVIGEEEAAELSKLGDKLEGILGGPQNVEWVAKGQEIFILNSKPINISNKEDRDLEVESEEEEEILLRGFGASSGSATGVVRMISSVEEIGQVREGDILVVETVDPDWLPAIRRAAALVTDDGDERSYAVTISRELETPAVVGTDNATKKLEDGMEVTVEGSSGSVYASIEGTRKRSEKGDKEKLSRSEPLSINPTATEVKVNIGLPDIAGGVYGETQADGVGLLRAEHMLLSLGKHPRMVLQEGKEDLIVEKFSNGVGEVAEAFFPNPVWYRILDLKTSEFKELEGGEEELEETNPKIGWRGVRRSVDPATPKEQESLKVELKALKKVVEEGYSNLGVVLPMVQHPEELSRFKRILREIGLEPHDDIDVGIMVETPAAALIVEEFIEEGIDFVNLGIRDLTQFTLAVDRDNERTAKLYDELHPAVQSLVERVIKNCNEYNVESCVYGEILNHPGFLERLVKFGVTGVSVDPGVVRKVREMVDRKERKMILSETRRRMCDN